MTLSHLTTGGLRAEVVYAEAAQAREAGKGKPRSAPSAPQGGAPQGRNGGGQSRGDDSSGAQQEGAGSVEDKAGWEPGHAGAYGTSKNGLLDSHTKLSSDIKKFSNDDKKEVRDTIAKLAAGHKHKTTHPLPKTLPGWFSTKVGRGTGTIMVHRTHEDGHLYVGGVFTQHAYDQAERRLGSVYIAALVYGGLEPGLSWKHTPYSANWKGMSFGQHVEPPTAEEVYDESANGRYPDFEHQVIRNGYPVAKLNYTIDPHSATIHVNGLATHPKHVGKGLASHLMDQMQDHAERAGLMIDHGSRTAHGVAWFNKYETGDTFKPHVHLPSTRVPLGNDADARDFRDDQFDPEEMKRGYQASRVYAGNSWVDSPEPRGKHEAPGGLIGGMWEHLYDNRTPGWEHHDPTDDQPKSLGRARQRGKHRRQAMVVTAEAVQPLEEHEQEARLHPDVFKTQSKPQGTPVSHIVEGARSYNAARGMGDPHDVDYSQVRTTADNTREIGRAYHALPEHDPDAIPHYEALRQEIHQQFHHLTNNMGVKVEFHDQDPYKTSKDMIADLHNNRTLKVLKTAGTGSHPYFSDEENDKFRAIHDAFGHAATGRGFDKHGEEAAFTAHSKMFSGMARRAMATETRGQNHFYNLNGKFAQQKLALLPEEHQGNQWTGQP